MSETWDRAMNRASQAQIAEHLRRCDADFIPPLTDRIEFDGYAYKLASKAERFEAWADDALVGLVAVYCNDVERRTAFITSVSVLRGWQGRRIASQLLEQAIAHAIALSFDHLELEVDRRNAHAIALYEKTNFIAGPVHGQSMTMHLDTLRKQP